MFGAAIAAVDVGSGYVKAIANGLALNSPRVSFPSVVGEFPEHLRNKFGANKISTIVYDGKIWLTGEDALVQLRQYQVANTLNRNWAGSVPWMVLLLRALFDLGIHKGNIELVTGIPQAQYNNERWRGIAGRLMGEHSAVVDGKHMHINIIPKKRMIMPLAAAGMYYWLSQDASLRDVVLAGGLIGGIDVGTYTTGLAALKGGKPALQLSGGIDIGMSRVAARVGTRINNTYNVALDFKRSMRLVENRRKVYLEDNFIDISEDVSDAVREIVSVPLKNAISSIWGNEVDFMRIGVYGGGAADFFPIIKQVFKSAELVGLNSMGGGSYLPVLGMLTYYMGANKE